jgi:hypothetical protein
MKNTTLEEVTSYLEEHFPAAELQVEKAPEDADVLVTIKAGSLAYILRVTHEFLEDCQPQEVKMIVNWLDLAAELKRAEGTPMVLTEHGIRTETA